MARWMIGIVLGVLLVGVLGVVGMAIRSHVNAGPAPEPVPAPATASGETDPTMQGDPDAADLGGDAVAPARPSAASPLPAPASVAAQPLPPLDVLVADILDTLEQRARAGDAHAACRLASELGRCGTLARRRALDLGRSLANTPQRAVTDELVETAARMSLGLEQDERACAGVPPARTREAGLWLHRAAAAGHHASMLAFASGTWMTMDDSFIAHPEVVAAYSRDAAAMARATIEAGDLTLATAVGVAQAGNWSGVPLQHLVPADDAAAYALLTAARDVAGQLAVAGTRSAYTGPASRTLEELESRLDPAQRTRAEAERRRLVAKATAPDAKRPPQPDGRRPWGGGYFAVAPWDCDR